MFHTELQLTDEQLYNLTLLEIEKILELSSRSLSEFESMPYPKDYITAQLGNRLIYDEHNYNVEDLKVEFQELFNLLTGFLFIHHSNFNYAIIYGSCI
jgi:hypothetical protein